jgi:NAD(P)H-dependent FMN reductase
MRIGVVLGSSRPQRLGERVCRYVIGQAADVGGAEFAVLDLADYGLPFFEELVPPLSNRDRTATAPVQRWLDDVRAADGFVFLTPEYNYAIPAVLKNALDYLADEAEGKPATIISYSDTMHGGNIAGHELRLTLGKLGMLPLPKGLPLAHADQVLSESGGLAGSPWAVKVGRYVPVLLAELVRYARALRDLRDPATASSAMHQQMSAAR